MTWLRTLLWILTAIAGAIAGFALWWRYGGAPAILDAGPPDNADQVRLRGIVEYYQRLAEQRRLSPSETDKMQDAAQALATLGGDHGR